MGLVMEAPRGLKGRVPYREIEAGTMADSIAFSKRLGPREPPQIGLIPKGISL